MMAINLNSAPRHLVNRVTSLATATQQAVTSFATAGLTGYLSSRISENMVSKGGNPLEAALSSYGDTFLLTAWIAVVGLILCLLLRKPKLSADL